MKIQKLLFVILLLCAELANAQNARFSQIGSAPISLNPALTGRFDGRARLIGLYSAQTTRTAELNHQNISLDFKIGKFRSFGDDEIVTSSTDNNKRITKEAKDEVGPTKKLTGYWGVGLNYYHFGKDDAALKATYYSASIARHFYSQRNKYFGIGAQVTYAEGDLDERRGLGNYDKEISGGQFRYPRTGPGTIPADILISKKNYVDYNIGAYYGMVTDAVGFELGGAMYHLFYPQNDILNKDDETRLRHRITAFSVLRVRLNNKWGLVQKNIYWQEGLYYRSKTFNDSLNIVAFWAGAELIKTQPKSNINVNFGFYTRSFRTVMPYLNINLGKIVALRYSYEFPVNTARFSAYTAKRHEAAIILSYKRNTAPGVRFYKKTNFW